MKLKFYISYFLIISCAFSLKILFSQQNVRIVEEFNITSLSGNEINGWEEKSFVGNTRYDIIKENENNVLHAFSKGSASGLYKEIKYSSKEWPYLSWRWKVKYMPPNGDVHFKDKDDYGARIYVIFPRFLKWKTKTISYIWANKLPKNEKIPNSWLPKNVIMVAVESGADSLGKWVLEKRNIYNDYKTIFNEEPPDVGAIAIMSDSDNTNDKAEAFYDDIKLLKY